MLEGVNNVKDDDLRFPDSVEKAVEILIIINNRCSLSRKELAEHLKEMGLGKLADYLLNGTLRKTDKHT